MAAIPQNAHLNKQTIPAWAIKLIADAQIPNPRWLRFKPGATFNEILDAVCDRIIRICMAKAIMQMIAEKKIKRKR